MALGILVIAGLFIIDAAVISVIVTYLVSGPSFINPNPEYPINIPLSFNYYYNNGTNYGTPNFAITIWLTGQSPVPNTIIAGVPFTLSARADQANKTSPLNETRDIVIFMQGSYSWPASVNKTNGLPNSGVTTLCQAGQCTCQANKCTVPIAPTSTSNLYWSKENDTFYFPQPMQSSPVVRFFTLGPYNQTAELAVAYEKPAVGAVSLTVEPSSYIQNASLSNEDTILSLAELIVAVLGTMGAAYVTIKRFVRRRNQ